MAGLYAADGSWNISVVNGATPTGLFAADGSMNCVVASGSTPVGLNHPCGARWITVATSSPAARSAADGSMNVAVSPYTFTFAQRVTVVSGSLGGDAAQTTAFLARTSGLDGTHTTAYKTLINGLVSDLVFTKLDALYILASQDSATSLLNLVSASFPLTTTGTITFTANQGYAGNGTDGRLNTGFIPSTAGGNYTLNSAHHSAYVRTSRAAGAASSTLGTSTATGSSYSYMETYNAGSARVTMNDATFSGVANANAQGMYVTSRTTNLALAMRRNQGALFSSGAIASVALPDQQYLISCNQDVGGSPANFITDQIAAVSLGGGLTSVESDALASRINAYMTSLGTNVY